MVAPDEARPVRALLHNTGFEAGPPGLKFVNQGDSTMAKASADGIFTTEDESGRVHRFKARKGDVLPEGATLLDETPADDAAEKPAKQAKAAERGPSETTAAKAPKESS